MTICTTEELADMLKAARISRRLIRDLRFVPEEVTHIDKRDFLVIATRSGNEGVLMYEGAVHPFELQRRSTNKSGRVEAVICDICATWQRGTNSAILTLKKSAERTVSYLVCADLECSLNVRDMTSASKLSRAQLREQITPDGRIVRLHQRLGEMLTSQISSSQR